MRTNVRSKASNPQQLSDADVQAFIGAMCVKGAAGRVPREHREKLARALGKIVADVGAGDPYVGLTRVKKDLTKDVMPLLHEHRERIVLLPAEPVAKGGHKGCAGWGEYLRFADKALDLLADGRQGSALSRYKLAELKNLVSIGKGAEPETDKRGNIANELLQSFSRKLAAAVTSGTRIDELWEALEDVPFEVVSADDSQSTGIGPLAALSAVADELPNWPLPGLPRRFQTVNHAGGLMNLFEELASTAWSRPIVPLGWFAFKEEEDVFVLPPAFRGLEDQIQWPNGEVQFEKYPEFAKWHAKHSDNPWKLPNVKFDEGRGYGWYTNQFYALCRVYLQIRPGTDGEPEAFILKEEANEVIPKWNIHWPEVDEEIDINMDVVKFLVEHESFPSVQLVENFPYQPRLIANAETMVELGLPNGNFKFKNGMIDIEIPFDEYIDEEAGDDVPSPEADQHFGSEEPLWSQSVASALTGMQDTQRDSILFNRGQAYKFYPLFKFDESLPSAAPAGSVAAALIANTHAEPQDRIVAELRAQAEKIAKAGLAFVDGLREFHQVAIDNM